MSRRSSKTFALAGLAVALAVAPASGLAQGPPVVTHTTTTSAGAVEPDSDRIARFLAGADWRKTPPRPGRPLPPGQEASPHAPPPEPTWWQTWRKSLVRGLQAAPGGPVVQPLLARPPIVLPIDGKLAGLPRAALPLPWPQLTCPPAPPTRPGPDRPALTVTLHLLQVSDEGQHVVGIDLACLRGATLLRLARLVTVTDSQGRPGPVAGLLLEGPWPVTGLAPEGQVGWPLAPARLSGQQPALSVVTTGGWLLQAERAAAVEWQGPDGRLTLQAGPADASEGTRRRLVLRLDARGLPHEALFDADAAPVQPLPHEGAWEAEFSSARVLLQRVGRLAPVPGGALPAVVDAGYLAWRLQGDKAVPVPVPLPKLAREGAWDCQAEGEPPVLACRFVAPPGPGSSVPADVTLRWTQQGFVVGGAR